MCWLCFTHWRKWASNYWFIFGNIIWANRKYVLYLCNCQVCLCLYGKATWFTKSFILPWCVGTDNKFNAETVILRWRYIVSECKKRNIHVISYGGDGATRLMRAMQISTGLFHSSSALTETVPTSTLKSPCIPESWSTWFHIKHPTAITYVQDTVHIAVKLKTRLLKHSVIMPMGNYIVAVQHLRLLHTNLQKEQHGLRERDIDCKD